MQEIHKRNGDQIFTISETREQIQSGVNLSNELAR